MKIIKGSLLDIRQGIIIHQVNAKYVMGAGIAKQIRAMWPQHYDDYMSKDLKLGHIVRTKVTNYFGIMGIIAQDGYGRDKRYTNYKAFKSCLIQIDKLHQGTPNVKIYMPFGIGCGLAGGEWSVISKLIEEICPYIILVSFN